MILNNNGKYLLNDGRTFSTCQEYFFYAGRSPNGFYLEKDNENSLMYCYFDGKE